MAFTASAFIYNGIPSDAFGLYCYSFNRKSQGNGVFGGDVTVLETRIPSRPTPLHYGVSRNDPAEFELIFGTLGPCPLDRFQSAAIAEWLIGPKEYCWLHICQPDLDYVRYRCIVSSLEQLPVNNNTVAFLAKIRCDGPYAYSAVEELEIDSASAAVLPYTSPSNIQDPHYPVMTLELRPGANEVSVWSDRDATAKFTLSDLPMSTPTTITVDNLNQVISGGAENWYSKFNFNFFRIWPGENEIHVDGNCKVTIQSQPFMNVGY